MPAAWPSAATANWLPGAWPGGYLKTFEFQQSMAWAIRLLNRYTAAETTVNAALGHDICPETNQKTGKDGL